ncbi:Protein FMP32, mitochondrial [Talaromyces islandicus]|uniref:Protein FMP32, mitochondrial n=1 Tax=Talaromyces islandicus TaxID=28573 RepID=A0A0U1LZ15_TALIS|nr:Protein FMP32, mitochondrial [Talaromyces islandicus]
MAPSKPIAPTPRFLLPRLTWNGTPRLTTTALPASTSRPQVDKTVDRLFGLQRSNIHNIVVESAHGPSLVSKQSRRRPSASAPTTTATTTTTACSNPIRHNGVYVAAFRPARRAFHASAVMRRTHHFDTLKFVQRLRNEGFSEEQSVALMKVLNDVIQESIQNLTRTMVLKEDSERATYTQKVDFAKLRSELLNSDSNEAQLTRSSHERIAADLAKMNSRLRDEIGRTQASVRLDLNLEKGRIREEANSQDMRIKETETRIEQEVAGLRERVQAVKQSTLQWLVGVCTGTAALIVGAWRLLM